MALPRRKKPPTPLQSLRVQAEARSEVAAAERRQLDVERMSSYSDDAFECESPHAMLASSRQRSDFRGALYEEHPVGETPAGAGGHTQTGGASPYLVVDNIGRLRVDSASDSDAHDDVAYGQLAQPRPEIILRWKRFAVLVLLTAVAMSGIAAWLRRGFVVYHNVDVDAAESKADTANSYIGLLMGFVESIVGLGVEEVFPVFIVYLHNLRWYPGDDPATKRQSKFKKFALTIFIPAVMMAVGSSLSAIQANQQDENSSTGNSTSSSNATITTRHLMQDVMELERGVLQDSILKTALARKVDPMPPLDASVCTEQEIGVLSPETLLAATPKAVFGFPLQEWGAEFGNAWYRENRESSSQRYDIANPGSEIENAESKLSDIMPLETAYDLWLQGSAPLLKSLRSTRQGLTNNPPSSVAALVDDVLTMLNATNIPVASSAAANASFESLQLNYLMHLDVMTLKIPLDFTTNSSVVCGESSCALLEPQLKPEQRLPRKQIGMMQLGRNCSLPISGSSATADCETVPDGALLFGFTTVTTVVPGKTSDSTAATRTLVLSFARLSWQFEDAMHDCASSDDDSQVLHYELTDGRHLVTPKQWLPSQLQASPVPLVQLMEPKLRLRSSQASRFATLELLESWPQDKTSCSSVVDTYLQYVSANHFYFEGDMVETMAASALLFIFQNARVLDTAPSEGIMMIQRRLADSGSKVKIFLTNTSIGNACTWTACGVLLVLTILVLALPNERARLSPPRGGNARAERFVSVQTEQIYPNLIYKKRFLIGKTGEEIKFGEFAVESVGLHHKMEEDEQIYI